MKSRAVRALLVVIAVAAQAGAAMAVWQFQQQIGVERSAADNFERGARQAVIGLTELRAAQQAYVADGQVADTWLARVTTLRESITPELTALRLAASAVEAQTALETAVESFSSFAQSDAKARDYLKADQRLSASDVVFADGATILAKVVNAIDTARGQESVARAVTIAGVRQWALLAIGAAVAVTFLVLVLLVPIPRGTAAASDAEAEAVPQERAGLGLSQAGQGTSRKAAIASDRAEDDPLALDLELKPPAPKTPDLTAVADICSSLARVQDSRDLPGLLERTAKTLDASGVIIWMPDGPQGALRPLLAHGYSPTALARMGKVEPTADNATATAFRTRAVVVVPTEVLASGAVVAPLVTPDGCTGAMAVELREGIEATDELRAVATILAAQLATLITPGAPAAAPPAPVDSLTPKP